MELDDFTGDREPETGPLARSGDVATAGTIEALEHVRDLLFGNPDSGIGDSNAKSVWPSTIVTRPFVGTSLKV